MTARPARGVTKTHTCEGCGSTLPESMLYQMWTGWHRMHPKGSTMIGKRAEQRFACKPCVEAFAKTGTTWEQLSLL